MKPSNHRMKRFLAGSSIIALVLGFFIYVFFRTDTYISEIVLSIVKVDPNEVMLGISHFPKWIIAFLRNFSCDILWAYSLTVILSLVIGVDNHGLLKTFIICVLFESGIEYLQKINVISGTFDIADILFEVVVSVGTLLIIKKKEG